MSNPLRIHKKLSDKHVVWFGERNQWIGFEAPAYKVFKMYERKKKQKKIVSKIQEKYALPKKDAKRFVVEIITMIEALLKQELPVSDQVSNIQINKKDIDAFSIRHYTIKDQVFKIVYGTKLIEYYIHPPLAHLENSSHGKADETYYLINKKGNFIMESEVENIKWSYNEIPRLKRRVTLSILNSIYNSNTNEWFSRVHASAITDEKQAIILSSESGSGKSTLAMLLQTKGYRVLSDDIVPLHSKNGYVYPVPTGISIKKGAFKVVQSYFPDFDPNTPNKYKFAHKELIFSAPKTNKIEQFIPVPATTLVFIKYKPDIEHDLTELTLFEALGRYHEEAWVDSTPENAQLFIDWFEKLSCFQLEYSNTEMAMDTIASLFNGENHNLLQQ